MAYVKKTTQKVNIDNFNVIKEKYEKEHEAFLSQADFLNKLDWAYTEEEYLIEETAEHRTLKKYKNTLDSLLHTQSNLEKIFMNNKQLNKFRYNEFSKTNEFDGVIYDEDKKPADIRCWFRRTFDWCPSDQIKDTIQFMLNRNSYNPIKEYLESLKWDGTPRLETFMQQYYNADDTKLTRAYFKKWMVAVIKRVYEPGCKFDNMLLIQGEQGKCKSTLFVWLGTINGISYYNVAPGSIKDKQELVYATKDKLILNFDDFDDICDKGNIGAIKEFITIQTDKTALKYEHAKEYKRQFVLCGTTNKETFLSDDGTKDERRFWIIPVKSSNSEFNIPDEIKDQLYAEAYTIYMNDKNFKLWIDDEELKMMEIEHQKKFKNAYADPIADKILYLFERRFNLTSGKFKSETDFKVQLDSNEPTVSNGLFGEDDYYVKYIPTRWINDYVLGGKSQRSGTRIVQILHTHGIDATERPMRYNKTICRCVCINSKL